MSYTFPFGQQISVVQQRDRTPKKVFVLGVYASAVHACWRGNDKKIKVKALAVASEPYIFWKGDGVQEIINKISMPKELGYLEPALPMFNGPSGIALDELFLRPLRISRKEAWLCDLLPFSRLNPNQKKALAKFYEPEVIRYDLPRCSIPYFTKKELKLQSNRHIEILEEIEESQCDTIILLGDLPVKYWLAYFSKFRKLSDFGDNQNDYGNPRNIKLNKKDYVIIPLVHPRQAVNLGKTSKKWNELHSKWVTNQVESQYK